MGKDARRYLYDRGDMVSNTAINGWHATAWDLVVRLGDADGSASHPHLTRLVSGTADQRMLGDAVHALCSVHGRHPGMIEDALYRRTQADAHDWLEVAATGFATERAYLAQLTSAAGPMPSTPGHAESEAALAGGRHALEMLARSDRTGCATGAVAGLLHDWVAIRRVLDAAAARFGIRVIRDAMPPTQETATIVAALGDSPGCERAISFGAQQLYAQHRGLWSLLEARASARGDI